MTWRSLRVPWVLAGVAVAVAATVAVVLLLTGTRFLAIATPSMGTIAPVGTLVVAQPQAHYGVGDIISFTENTRIITHRIVGDSAQGFITQGDLNGAPDGWRVTSADIIGKEVWLAPGLGFLLRALPWLLLGVVLVDGVVRLRFVPHRWRWSIRMIGWAITVTLVSWWLQPWFNMELLDWRAVDDGPGVLMHVVNTGLFPLSANGQHVVMGQDVVAVTTDQLRDGAYVLNPVPELSLWLRIALVIVCLLPLLFAVLRRDRDLRHTVEGDAVASRAAIRGRIVAVIAAVTVIIVVVLGALTSGASFAASVQNSTNSVGTRTLFSCAPQATDPLAGSKRFVYAMGTSGVTSETDMTGHGFTGTYQSTTTVSSVSPVACPRDTPVASVTFNGTNQCLFASGQLSSPGPNTFSLEGWFKTSNTSNGKIIGFGDSTTSGSDVYFDRHVYIDPTGRVVFGVYPNAVKVIATSAGTNYANGAWHHVVASLSSAGMKLYVDGALAASDATVTVGASGFSAYWKVGCGNLAGWADGAGNSYSGPSYFTGQIRFSAVYTVALTAAQVTARYTAGTP